MFLFPTLLVVHFFHTYRNNFFPKSCYKGLVFLKKLRIPISLTLEVSLPNFKLFHSLDHQVGELSEALCKQLVHQFPYSWITSLWSAKRKAHYVLVCCSGRAINDIMFSLSVSALPCFAHTYSAFWCIYTLKHLLDSTCVFPLIVMIGAY